MRDAVICVLLAAALCAVASAYQRSPPKVQLYSRDPGQFGEDNMLICFVSGFHPPDITIQLLRNGEELPNADQTDLAFKANWQFHLTKSASFTPKNGEKYLCHIDHGSKVYDIMWGEDTDQD